MSSPELDSLLALLDQYGARQFVFYVDPVLVPLLSALAPYSVLTQHGVQALVPLNDEAVSIPHNTSNAVFVTTADPQAVALVSRGVAEGHFVGVTPVIVVPETPPSVPLLLTQYGVLGDVELKNWAVSLVPDPCVPDLLSCCLPPAVKHSSWQVAWALDRLQATSTGLFGKVTGVGPQGRHIMRLLDDRRSEHAVKQQQQQADTFEYHFGYSSSVFAGAEVEHAIIIDRDVDLVTPLLMQTTYAGVLAETVGISPSGTTGSKLPGAKFQLRNDAFFSKLANSSFAEACQTVHESAKKLQEEFQARSSQFGGANASLSEFRKVIEQLGSLETTKRLVNTHTELASTAMTELESALRREVYDLQTQMLDNRIANTQAIARIQDLVFQIAPLPYVLRLISLLALLRGGIKEQVLQNLFNGDICRTYGYQHLRDIENLHARGLVFSPRGSSFLLSTPSFASFVGSTDSSNTPSATTTPGAAANTIGSNGSQLLDTTLSQHYTWYTLNKAYKLYPGNDSAESMPYAGYVPLTARIVQLALDLLPLAKTPLEPEFQTKVTTPKDRDSWREAKLRRTLMRNSPGHEQPVVLVVVVGGVTYAEAEAIRLAVERDERKRRVVVASTGIITGDDIV